MIPAGGDSELFLGRKKIIKYIKLFVVMVLRNVKEKKENKRTLQK